MKPVLSILLCSALFFTLAGCSDQDHQQPATSDADHAAAAENATESSKTDATAEHADATDYPIDYCIVSGEKLGAMGDPVEVEVNGRTVKLCCNMCVPKLRKEPAKYLAMLDKAVTDDATQPDADAPPTDGHEHAH